MAQAVRIVTIPAHQVAYAAFDGDENELPRAVERVQGWIMGHKEPKLPIVVVRDRSRPEEASRPIEVYAPFVKILGDDAVPRLRSGKWPIDLREEPPCRVARARFAGDPERLPGFEAAVVRFLAAQGQAIGRRVRHVFRETGNEPDHWVIDVEVELAEP